jgi:hypothetical protein
MIKTKTFAQRHPDFIEALTRYAKRVEIFPVIYHEHLESSEFVEFAKAHPFRETVSRYRQFILSHPKCTFLIECDVFYNGDFREPALEFAYCPNTAKELNND